MRLSADGIHLDATERHCAVVGRKVSFTLESEPPGPMKELGFVGQPLSNIRWKIEGKIIKDVDASLQGFTITPLSPFSFDNNEKAEFYWIFEGVYQLTVSALVGRATTPQRLERTVHVLAPSVHEFTVETSGVTVTDQYPGAGLSLAMWDPSRRTPGCKWQASVETDVPRMGYFAFLQTAACERVVRADDGRVFACNTNGSALDSLSADALFYAQKYISGLNVIQADDSPKLALERGAYANEAIELQGEIVQASAVDSFCVYLMYRPDGGIWVPLKQANWGWSAVVTRRGDQYYDLYPAKVEPQVKASGKRSTKYPTWSGQTATLPFWYRRPRQKE